MSDFDSLCIVCNKKLSGHQKYFCSIECRNESVEKDAIMIARPLVLEPIPTSRPYYEEHKIHHPMFYNYRAQLSAI